MPLEPFDELDQTGLRVLGFTIDVTREKESLPWSRAKWRFCFIGPAYARTDSLS